MPALRNLILKFVSGETAAKMEAESKSWALRCPEGHVTSVWDAGGLRYKARGNPRRMVRCPQCAKVRWMQTLRFEDLSARDD